MLLASPPRYRQSSVTESVVLPPDPRGPSCLHFGLSWYRTIPATASRNLCNCAARCFGSPAPCRAHYPSGTNVGRSPLHCVASLETSGGWALTWLGASPCSTHKTRVHNARLVVLQ